MDIPGALLLLIGELLLAGIGAWFVLDEHRYESENNPTEGDPDVGYDRRRARNPHPEDGRRNRHGYRAVHRRA